MSDPMGISLFLAVLELKEGGGWWSVQDLIEQVTLDDRAADKTKDALENRLALARPWGIFSHEQIDPLDVFQAGGINVLDVGAWAAILAESRRAAAGRPAVRRPPRRLGRQPQRACPERRPEGPPELVEVPS